MNLQPEARFEQSQYEAESKEIIIRGGDWVKGRPTLIFVFVFYLIKQT